MNCLFMININPLKSISYSLWSSKNCRAWWRAGSIYILWKCSKYWDLISQWMRNQLPQISLLFQKPCSSQPMASFVWPPGPVWCSAALWSQLSFAEKITFICEENWMLNSCRKSIWYPPPLSLVPWQWGGVRCSLRFLPTPKNLWFYGK